jgi:autotransporter-associated beta strand protein
MATTEFGSTIFQQARSMKSKSILRFSAIAFVMASAVRAQVVNVDNRALHYGTLLTDNFNTPSYNWWEFNNSIAADQGGTLAAIGYNVSDGGGYTAQHSNGGAMLLTSDGWGGWGGMASPNRNFAADANATNKPLEIQFDMWAIQGDPSNWIGFGLGSGQGSLFFEAAYGFAATVGDGVHNLKFVISDAAGTGSGFNGIANGAKIDVYRDNAFVQTITETLGTNDGYVTFRMIPSAWAGWTIGHVDNLKVTNGSQTNPLATSTELNLTNNGSVNFGDVTQTVTKLDGAAGTTVNLLNSSLTVDGSVNSAFAGVISGNGGSLVKNGSGTLTLSGANTYTGGTTVTGGTLELSGATNGNAIIRGTVTVNSGAELRSTGGDGTGFGFNVGNRLDTIQINGGLVNSHGSNAHLWNAAVNMTGGELRVNGGISSLTGNCFEWYDSTVNTAASNQAATISGRINLRGDSGNQTEVFNVADGAAATDLLVSAALTESYGSVGITKNGAGTLELAGVGTYTGATLVTNGKLIVNGNISTSITTVRSGATISGSGTLGELTVEAGGTVAPGNSPGVLTFTGDLVLDAGSISNFEINGFTAGQYDLAIASAAGTQGVSFDGTLNLLFQPGFNTAGAVKIFDFDNYSGAFTSVVPSGLAAGYFASFDSATGIVSVASALAVPEPAAMIPLACILGSGCLVRRRRA